MTRIDTPAHAGLSSCLSSINRCVCDILRRFCAGWVARSGLRQAAPHLQVRQPWRVRRSHQSLPLRRPDGGYPYAAWVPGLGDAAMSGTYVIRFLRLRLGRLAVAVLLLGLVVCGCRGSRGGDNDAERKRLAIDSWRMRWTGDWQGIIDATTADLARLAPGDKALPGKEAKAADLYNQRGIGRYCLSEIISSLSEADKVEALRLAEQDFARAGNLYRSTSYQAGYAAAQSNLGMTLRHLGKVADAKGAYRVAIEADPSNGWAHNNLGWLLFIDERKHEDARRHLMRAKELKCPLAPVNLASLWLAAGELDKASAEVEFALDRTASSRPLPTDIRQCAMLNLGEIRRRSGDYEAARAAYEEAVRLNPRDAHAQLRLGAMQIIQAEYQRAAQSLGTAFGEYKTALNRGRSCLLACIAAARKEAVTNADELRDCVINKCRELGYEPDTRTWEGLLIGYLAGDASDSELLGQLSDADSPMEQARACEAFFVMAHRGLSLRDARGSPPEDYLRRSASCKGVEYLLEHSMANGELKRGKAGK